MTTFNELFEQYAASSLDKQWALSEAIGNHDWNLDLDRGTISFGLKHTFPIQILGTESDSSGTWLWAWANAASDIPLPLLQAAHQLREIGTQGRMPELTRAKLNLTRVDGHQLALVASGICNSDSYYCCPYEGGAAFVLLDAPVIRRYVKNAPSHLIGVFNQLISTFSVDHRKALTAYLQHKGYTLTAKGSQIEGVGPDSNVITTIFDRYDRVIDMTTTIGP